MLALILATSFANPPPPAAPQAGAGCVGAKQSGGCVGRVAVQSAGCRGNALNDRYRVRVRERAVGGCGGYRAAATIVGVGTGFHPLIRLMSPPLFVPVPSAIPVPMPQTNPPPVRKVTTTTTTVTETTASALAVVNAGRARMGLRPFVEDPGLTAAAAATARYRATYRIHGHTTGGLGDFRFLAAGVRAVAAGAGALAPSWGFRACCTDGNYQCAGAATVVGADGLHYHQIFVR